MLHNDFFSDCIVINLINDKLDINKSLFVIPCFRQLRKNKSNSSKLILTIGEKQPGVAEVIARNEKCKRRE
ncbi:MAG: hypothetical protein K0Q87_5339 [Neobacillus sp.]|jgi:hypothetical protein|nr:hypothetical protein [Neobacillus sp.]